MNAEQLIDQYLREETPKGSKDLRFDSIEVGTEFYLNGKGPFKKAGTRQATGPKGKFNVKPTQIVQISKDKSEIVGPAKPRRRSLKQKQGARKAGRTRTRRPYAEADPGFSHGWLHHYYYHRKHNANPPKA